MRPRARDKKLQEEWAVPLNSIDDICEVCFRLEFVLTGFFRLVFYFLFIYGTYETYTHQIFSKYCLGKLRSNPWSELDGLQPETKIINEKLGVINKKGFLTINSQPAVNGEKSDSPSVGKNYHF